MLISSLYYSKDVFPNVNAPAASTQLHFDLLTEKLSDGNLREIAQIFFSALLVNWVSEFQMSE